MNHFLSKEDVEDFEQEQAIQAWLKNHQPTGDPELEFKYISSKGTARNSRVRASISLDQQITQDSNGTFADLIAGSDGRSFYDGDDPEPNTILSAYIGTLLNEERLTLWVLKTLKYWITQNESLFLTSPTDSEW